MFFSKPARILFHVLGWILLFSLVMAFISNPRDSDDDWTIMLNGNFLLFCAVYLALFYLNSHVLIPALFLQKKYLLYFLITAVLLAGVALLRPFDRLHRDRRGERPPQGIEMLGRNAEQLPRRDSVQMLGRNEQISGNSERPPLPRDRMFEAGKGPRSPRRSPVVDITSIILFAMIWSVSMANTIIREWRQTQQKAAQAEAGKAKAELSFLKAQINPHFLFNTLNNIYSLAVTKNENTSTAIMKLSNIMRYVTDDVTQTQVPLQSEVDCISDYIDLQRLRLSDRTQVEFSASGDLEMKNINPLLLMTFVENVFKYGVSAHEPSPIIVRISADANSITLFCQNKVFASKPALERTGIGISNTRQRLEHLYPGRHSLEIKEDDGLFTVVLKLQA